MSLGFVWPQIFWALPAIAGFLVYAYLRKGQGQKQTVASLMFLKKLKTQVVARQKFSPPLRLLFEFCLLLLLLAAASGIHSNSLDRKLILLIDNSYSLNAIVPDAQPVMTLFDKVLAESEHALNQVSTAKVWVTSPELQPLSENWVSSAEAINMLAKIKPSYAEDRLGVAVKKLLRDNPGDKITVISDQQAEGEINEHLSFVSVVKGTPDIGNVGILDVGFIGNSNKSEVVNIRLVSFNNGGLDVKVDLEGLVDGRFKKLQTGQLSLPEMQTVEQKFESLDASIKLYKISVSLAQPGNRALATKIDAIKADNVAWLARGTSSKDIYVVSESKLSDLKIGETGIANFKQVNLDEYNKLNNEPHAWIFHHIVPDVMPRGNSLFVMPPTGNNLILNTFSEQPTTITNWDQNSEILRYVKLNSLAMRRISFFETPIWAQNVIQTNLGPILIVGSLNDSRMAFLGLEIFPYEGKENPILSILSLNIFKWLLDQSLQGGYYNVGETIVSPDQATRLINLDNDKDVAIGQNVRIAAPGGYVQTDSLNHDMYFAANYFNPAEQNVTKPGVVELSSSLATNIATNGDSDYLVNAILQLVLMIICLDLIYAVYRLSRRQKI